MHICIEIYIFTIHNLSVSHSRPLSPSLPRSLSLSLYKKPYLMMSCSWLPLNFCSLSFLKPCVFLPISSCFCRARSLPCVCVCVSLLISYIRICTYIRTCNTTQYVMYAVHANLQTCLLKNLHTLVTSLSQTSSSCTSRDLCLSRSRSTHEGDQT